MRTHKYHGILSVIKFLLAQPCAGFLRPHHVVFSTSAIICSTTAAPAIYNGALGYFLGASFQKFFTFFHIFSPRYESFQVSIHPLHIQMPLPEHTQSRKLDSYPQILGNKQFVKTALPFLQVSAETNQRLFSYFLVHQKTISFLLANLSCKLLPVRIN